MYQKLTQQCKSTLLQLNKQKTRQFLSFGSLGSGPGAEYEAPFRAHPPGAHQSSFWSSLLPEQEGQEMLRGPGFGHLRFQRLLRWGGEGPPPRGPDLLAAKTRPQTASNDSSFRSGRSADCAPGAALSILLSLSSALFPHTWEAARLSPGVGLKAGE